MDIKDNVMKKPTGNQKTKQPIKYNGVCVHVDTFRKLQSLRLRYKAIGQNFTNGALIDVMVGYFTKQVSKLEKEIKENLQ